MLFSPFNPNHLIREVIHSRDVNEARTLEAEAKARTLEAEAQARTLEAKPEVIQFWPSKFNKF